MLRAGQPNRNDAMTTPANQDSLGVPAADFLASVRRALGRPNRPPADPYIHLAEDAGALSRQAAELRQRTAAQLPDLLTQLVDTAARRGWNVRRAANGEDALDYILALARRLGIADAARSRQPVFDAIPIDAALSAAGVLCWPAVYPAADGRPPDDEAGAPARSPAHSQAGADARAEVRRRLGETGLGITGADYAISETGSVIILPRRGLSRLVSVVPPVHLAIVRPQDVLASLDDLFLLRRLEYHTNGGDMGSYLNFITGPSRTADIEQTIVVGVHGPRAVHLILMEQE